MAESVPRDDVIAFRLAAHHLSERLGEESLLEAAGAAGTQNSPPGSALLALHARVENVTPERLDAAIAEEKTLLQTWCMRGSPYFFPTADAPVFTTGVLPPTEVARRHLILGVEQSLDKLEMSLAEAVELITAEVREVLSGNRLAINELGKELATCIAEVLPPRQRKVWETDGPHAADQTIGEAVVHFGIRILTLEGIVCFAPRTGNKAPFVLVDEWLGHPLPDVDPEIARAELLRRYLRCYGPSTPKDFATWVGVFAGDVDPWWRLVEDELTEVEFGGRAWLLTDSLPSLRSAPIATGVRLLPPADPYLQARDRETIVEKKYHREVWMSLGEPGTVLADGKIVGTWRPRKSGRKLGMLIKVFDALPARRRKALEDEAEGVALLRGASSAQVTFE